MTSASLLFICLDKKWAVMYVSSEKTFLCTSKRCFLFEQLLWLRIGFVLPISKVVSGSGLLQAIDAILPGHVVHLLTTLFLLKMRPLQS